MGVGLLTRAAGMNVETAGDHTDVGPTGIVMDNELAHPMVGVKATVDASKMLLSDVEPRNNLLNECLLSVNVALLD